MPRWAATSEETPVRTVVKRPSEAKAERWLALFHERLRERGLKSTGQRDDIARVFFETRRHISAEELYAEVKKINPHVGYATIYRTLRLLKECELLHERHFDETQARYEVADEPHHDHFICERCGKIIEFENRDLERTQRQVARELGATLSRRRVELYGLCSDCKRSPQ
ncbi:MAG: transcriptional repressor [Deltaproteobacteria bacterium]|jgi:Fur family ferric uptake transcriptional regulator|nr:transcriptional repressor [Deltaproteobacteria bacterium]